MNNLFKVNVIPFNIRNTISFVLLIASFILLYFGVTEPMMKISAEYAGQEVFKYKQSILEAVDTLYEDGYLLVSFLILFLIITLIIISKINIIRIIFNKIGVKSVISLTNLSFISNPLMFFEKK